MSCRQIVHQTNNEEDWRIQQHSIQRENGGLLVEYAVQGYSSEHTICSILYEALQILTVVVNVYYCDLEDGYT